MKNLFDRIFKRVSPVPPEEDHLNAAAVEWLTQAGRETSAPDGFRQQLSERLRTHQPGRSPRGFLSRARQPGLIWAVAILIAAAVTVTLALPFLMKDGSFASGPQEQSAGIGEATSTASATEGESPLKRAMLSFLFSSAQAQSLPELPISQGGVTLNADFPEGPDEGVVYEQVPDAITSVEQAKAAAVRMGIYGGAYLPSADFGKLSYLITDGARSASFGDSTTNFTYTILNSTADYDPESLSPEDRVFAAADFIKSTGLLDFDVQVNEKLSHDDVVVFNRVLDGFQQIENDSYTSYIVVTVGENGEITSVVSRVNDVSAMSLYPLRSAEEAWNIVLANPDDPRVKYSLGWSADLPRTIDSSWAVNTYPIGERVDLYTYLGVYPSAEEGGQAWVRAEGFTLKGDLAGLLAANDRPPELLPDQKAMIAEGVIDQETAELWPKFFHVWGQSSVDENGARILQVEGWENSAMPDETLEGVFREVDSQIVFVDQNNRQWLLADLPDEVPLGIMMAVRGVRDVDRPGWFIWNLIRKNWSDLITFPDGFPEVTPTPLPKPGQQGTTDPVEAREVGELIIDQIDLVYYANNLAQITDSIAITKSQLRFVQPVWRFSGTLGEDLYIEILVQAVEDDYLH